MAHRKADLTFENILDHTHDLFAIANFDNFFIKLNKKWEDLTGYSLEELMQQPFTAFIHPEDLESTIKVSNEITLKGKDVLRFENRYIRKDGGIIRLEWNSVIDSKKEIVYSIARDITSTKHQEAFNHQAQKLMIEMIDHSAFERNESGFIHHLLTNLVDLYQTDCASFWEFSSHKDTIYCHESAVKPGIKPRSGLIVQRSVAKGYFDAILNKSLIVVPQVMQSPDTKDLESYFKAFEVCSLLDAVVNDDTNKYIICLENNQERHWTSLEANSLLTFTNILANYLSNEERRVTNKNLADSEKRYRSIIEALNEGVLVHDMSGTILECNDSACKIFETTKEQLIGLKPDNNKWPAYHLDGIELKIEEYPSLKTIRTGQPVFGMNVKLHFGPKEKILSINTQPIINREGNIYQIVSSLVDITEDKKREENLSEALKQKDTLFRELHHRIKNNLNMVSSLLSLKSQFTKDENLKEFVQETKGRIYSIAKTHEQLLKLEEFNQLEIKEYLEDLVSNILRSFSTDNEKYEVVTSIETHKLHTDVVLTIGLLINEIVSNIIKYAYDPTTGGRIEIRFRKQEDQYELMVRDFGEGLQDVSSESLGLTLIKLFVQQLEGTIVSKEDKGLVYTIKIPIAPGE